jgi:hypothetical protein
MEKNCLFCKHFRFATGEPDWSEVTPGHDIEIGCKEDIWELDNYIDTETSFRRKMLTAKSCDQYEERDKEVTNDEFTTW